MIKNSKTMSTMAVTANHFSLYEAFKKEVEKLEIKINELKEMSIIKIWENELQELLIEWNNHKEMIEEDYNNDLKGEVVKTKSTKKVAQKKK
jgi:hypothetical protein